MIAAAVFLVAISAGPFLTFRLYARRVEAADQPVADRMHRLRRAHQIGFVALPVAGIVGMSLLGLMESAVGTVDAIDLGGPLGAAAELGVIFGVVFGVAVVPIAAAVVGSYPVQRRMRETTASIWRVLRGVLAGIGFTAVVLLGWLGLVIVLPDGLVNTTAFLVVVFGLFVTAVFGLAPYLTAVLGKRVPLEGERRERVAEICADLGYEPRGVFLLEGESVQEANAMVAGSVPGYRYVFLTDYLLSEFEDDELRAVIAHEFGHVDENHLWQRGLVTVGFFGGLMLLSDVVGFGGLESRFGFLGFFLPFVGLLVVYAYLILGGLALRQEYRADAYAARHAGRETTASALDRLADANDARREASLLYSLATHHPPIQDRIEALSRSREEADTRSSETRV